MKYIKIISFLIICVITLGCKKEVTVIENNPYRYDIYYQNISIGEFQCKNDTLYYDINNDTIMDIAVTKQIDTLEGYQFRYSGKLFSLRDTMLFTFLRIEPSYGMLDTLDYIDNSDNFLWNDTIVYIGTGGWEGWNTVFNYNVGFQLKGKHNLYFGWSHFKTMELNEIALNRIPNSPIKIGQKK